MEYKVKKFVEVPLSNVQKNAKYPGLFRALGELAEGECIFVPGGEQRRIGGLFQGHPTKKFSMRSETQDGVAGVGIYCTLSNVTRK